MRRILHTMLLTALGSAALARAENQAERPVYRLLRPDEDWSALRDPAVPTDGLDALKFIPLNQTGSAWLTLGGEARERYEYFENASWGAGPQDEDGYFLHRFMLHADAHLGGCFRVFAQVKSGWQTDRIGGPRPTDRDEFDLHQVFTDISLPLTPEETLRVRLGRQELMFGSQRLVSVRESPNVRQGFDAIRATFNRGGWRLDAFAAHPVKTDPGVWDDDSNGDAKFWGLYSVAPFPVLPGGNVDLYYLGIERDTARYVQGVGPETRHSIGTRLWGKHAGWDWDFEFVYQFGEFGKGGIAACTAASDTGYTVERLAWRPRFGLKADITSGDRDPNNPDLQTFYALFPKGAYFSENSLIGPASHIDLHPSLELHPARSVTITLDGIAYWRESAHDGVYNSGLNVARAGLNGGSRFVGSQAGAQIDWKLQSHLTWTANYSHFFAGTFLEQNPPAADVNYFSTWITFRF